MITYWMDYSDRLMTALSEHLQLVLTALIVALIISICIIRMSLAYKKLLDGLIYFFSTLYSVPSYALFALLIPLTGLGSLSAIIVLTLYCQYILLRTFVTGLRQIDPVIIESAVGMGMTEKQVFFRIQLPLATRSIFAGMRIALTSTIGIATIAATINAGGLGTILFEGLRTQSIVRIAWGTIVTMFLCIACNGMLLLIERIIVKRYELEG